MNEQADIPDLDRDCIHILPLSFIPLESGGLRRLRMVKNDDLESVIEVFRGESGRGQIEMAALELNFPDVNSNDARILRTLAKLTSYDVFSLRVHMRKLDIAVDEHDHLKLSETKQAELQSYMTVFTQRLIQEVFGAEDSEIKDFGDVLALYQNPNKELARSKLQLLADSLDITIENVPGFLEDYGDIYLSIAYYKDCLQAIKGPIVSFDDSIHELRRHPHLKQDRSLMAICSRLQGKIEKLSATAEERFRIFEKYTDEMWKDIDADRFRDFKKVVVDNHTALGAILCTLSVKMEAWKTKFPTPKTGGLFNRAEFVRVGMQRGF